MARCVVPFALLLLVSAAPYAGVSTVTGDQTAPYVTRTQKQFNFYPGGKLEIAAGIPGNYRLVGWGKASVLIEVENVIYDLPADQAKLLSDQYPTQIRWTQTSATVRTSGPPQNAANMEANVTCYVPKEKTDIKLRLPQGDLAVGDINGWIEATLGEGNIEATTLQGYFSGITQKGDLKVDLSGKRWNGFGFTGVTQQGTIELQLPRDYSAALQLETREGQISVDFPEQLVDGASVPLNVVKQKNARSLTATVGDGGSPVKLLTVSGDIHLSAKTTQTDRPK